MKKMYKFIALLTLVFSLSACVNVPKNFLKLRAITITMTTYQNMEAPYSRFTTFLADNELDTNQKIAILEYVVNQYYKDFEYDIVKKNDIVVKLVDGDHLVTMKRKEKNGTEQMFIYIPERMLKEIPYYDWSYLTVAAATLNPKFTLETSAVRRITKFGPEEYKKNDSKFLKELKVEKQDIKKNVEHMLDETNFLKGSLLSIDEIKVYLKKAGKM